MDKLAISSGISPIASRDKHLVGFFKLVHPHITASNCRCYELLEQGRYFYHFPPSVSPEIGRDGKSKLKRDVTPLYELGLALVFKYTKQYVYKMFRLINDFGGILS